MSSIAGGNGALRAVGFDWDGTLVDSAEATYNCYAEMFAALGVAFDRASFARTYSPAWQRTYVALGVPESRWKDADAMFVAAYARQQVRLLPGARELLQALHERGVAMALVTSGSRARVPAEVLRLGLGGYFRTIVCGEDVLRKKPDPEGLLRALSVLGAAPQHAAYVGDSPEDVGMAHAAGARAIGLLGGFPNREALRASAPAVLATNLAEVGAALS